MSDRAGKALLRFADGEALEISVDRNESILAAARAVGISLASDCEDGFCATCLSRLVAGDVRYEDVDELVIDEDERAAGDVLICQARPASSALEIELPYARASVLPKQVRTLTVDTVRRLSASVWEVVCRSDDKAMFDFLAGQYVNLAVPGAGVERAYSMANAPGSDSAAFLIRELPDGAMSRYLATAKPGDQWRVRGPNGVFYRRSFPGAPIVMVAGGTGLAPMLSMLRELADKGETAGDILLVFGVTDQADAFYAAELAAIAETFPNLQRVTCAMTHDATWSGVSGTVVDGLATRNGFDPASVAYLCGPPAMVDAVRPALAQRGVEEDRIFAEEFLPADA